MPYTGFKTRQSISRLKLNIELYIGIFSIHFLQKLQDVCMQLTHTDMRYCKHHLVKVLILLDCSKKRFTAELVGPLL